jgi:hypothetical protein
MEDRLESHRRGRIRKLFAALVLGALPVPALVGRVAADSATPPAGLIVSGDGVKAEQGATYRRDFGVMDPDRVGALRADFALANTGTTPVEVVGLASSCHCTTATIQSGTPGAPGRPCTPSTTSPLVLDAGGAAIVHVLVQPEDSSPGAYSQTVQVQTDPARSVEPVLEISWRVRPPVTFVTPVVDLGRIEAGSGATGEIQVRVDRDIVGNGPPPKLHSSDPDIVVALVDPAGKSTSGLLTYGIRVARSAACGRTLANLTFDQSWSGRNGIYTDYWSTAHAVVVASVAGALSAEPPDISFWLVGKGASAPDQTIAITGPASEIAAAAVKTSGKWLNAVCAPCPAGPRGSASTMTRAIIVGLNSARSATGLNTGRVTVVAPGGDRLDIPVSVFVAESPAGAPKPSPVAK